RAARWHRKHAGNYESGVDDREQALFDVSRARHFFAGGRAHGSWRSLEEGRVTVGGKEMKMKFMKTFSDVPVNEPLLYIDSRGHLGLAINQDSFVAKYGIKPPAELFIPRAK